MRKALTLILLLISTFFTANAQSNAITTDEDSVINVIAWFNKNDTTEYLYSKSEITISGNDTTRESGINERFRVVVLDSTSDGYRLKYEPLSWDAETQKDSLKDGMMWAAKQQGPVVFTTNEYGEIQHLENWRAVRDKAIPIIQNTFEKYYEKTPGLDSIMPKKNFLSLIKIGFSTEESLQELYNEFTSLFDLHGNSYDIGLTTKDDSTTGYPLHINTLVTYEEPDTADGDGEFYPGDYLIRINATMTFPESDVKDFTNSLLGAILSEDISDETEKAVNDSLNVKADVRILTENHFFYSGWPKLIRKQTITKLGSLGTRVKTETIEWERYRWNEYDDSGSEDDNVTL